MISHHLYFTNYEYQIINQFEDEIDIDMITWRY